MTSTEDWKALSEREETTMDQQIAALVAQKLAKFGRPALEIAPAPTPIKVEHGPWSGHVVRRARRLRKCAGGCGHYIARGDLYLQGDCDPYEAGGFGHDHICVVCAGPMVLHAIARATLSHTQEDRS